MRNAPSNPLLAGLASPSADQAAGLLSRAPTLELESGKPYFRASFPSAALLVVDEGFVIVRATLGPNSRSIVTCDAGAGRIVSPPTSEELLCAVGDARLTLVSGELLDELLAIPGVAQTVVRQLATTLVHKQEAIANFAPTRHLERVRRRLLQLARNYGHVDRDGIRIDFPISHALLAEMVGSSRETVTRSLEELRSRGFVRRSGSVYHLLAAAETIGV